MKVYKDGSQATAGPGPGAVGGERGSWNIWMNDGGG